MRIYDHLDKLKLFTTVALCGSVSSASKELGLTQPAITRAIQTLENSVGFKLFSRDRNGMHLTEGGQIIFTTSIRLLKEISDAAQRGAFVDKEMVGNITLGTYESLAEYLWPKFLLKIQQQFPLLNVSLKTNSTQAHLIELNNGLIDILVDAEPRAHKGLSLWPLYSDRFNFYSSKNLNLNKESARSLPLLFVRGVYDEKNLTIEEHLSNQGYIFQREYTFDSFTTVKRMAIQGLGVAVLPQRLAKNEKSLFKMSVSEFKGGFGAHTIFATISPRREADKRIKNLISILKNELSERN